MTGFYVLRKSDGEPFHNLIGVFQRVFPIIVGRVRRSCRAEIVQYDGDWYQIMPNKAKPSTIKEATAYRKQALELTSLLRDHRMEINVPDSLTTEQCAALLDAGLIIDMETDDERPGHRYQATEYAQDLIWGRL